MAEDKSDKVKKLAENAALQVVSRLAMILVLPMMAWIGSTLVEVKVQLASQGVSAQDMHRRVTRLEAWRDHGFTPTR